jgi:hypothetical protein
MGLIDVTKAIESIDEIGCFMTMSVCMNSDYYYGMTAMKDAAIHAIEEQPTVDAVPVVRCAECKRWNRFTRVTFKDERKGLCEYRDHIMSTREDFYCADGERKENGMTEYHVDCDKEQITVNDGDVLAIFENKCESHYNAGFGIIFRKDGRYLVTVKGKHTIVESYAPIKSDEVKHD